MATDITDTGHKEEEITSDLNHYEVLGVDQDATHREILAAYRALVQKHHPDKGGDPEVYQLISKAWEVLSSDETRRVYDVALNSGYEFHPNEIMQTAENVITSIFSSVLENIENDSGDPATRNWLAEVAAHIENNMENIRAVIKKNKKKIRRIKRVHGRFKLNRRGRNKKALATGQNNLFEKVIRIKLEDLESELKENRKARAVGKTMLTMLDYYSFENAIEPDPEFQDEENSLFSVILDDIEKSRR